MFAPMARATLRRRSDGVYEIVRRRKTLPRVVLAAAAVGGAGALTFLLVTLYAAYAFVGVPLLLGAAILAGLRAAPHPSEPLAPAIQLRPRPDEGPTVATRRS
jgi:hypothetical protein